MSKRRLKELLDKGGEIADCVEERSPTPDPETDPSLCVECGDMPFELVCLDCNEQFCAVCFEYIHRTGKRKIHRTRKIDAPAENGAGPAQNEVQKAEDEDIDLDADFDDTVSAQSAELAALKGQTEYIPMRLTLKERRLFRLLEAALNVSEYTDKVDIFHSTSKTKRIVQQLREMCTILTGLVVAEGMEEGQQLMEDRDFLRHAEWYQQVFEIGRRYKIMNPEKMRSTYGKLMYMLMDSQLPEVQEQLEFHLHMPVKTVHLYLSEHDALALLDDPLVLTATREIGAAGKSKVQVQREIKEKHRAIEVLARRHAAGRLGLEEVRQVLYSIGDYFAYLGANRSPVLRMIELLKQNFDPLSADEEWSLNIRGGHGGARLTHSHSAQYQYVLQSFTLWSEIMRDIYLLWKMADEDLSSEQFKYLIADTGNGLNRVKPSPKVARAMHNIIGRVRKTTSGWVGSSVVHIGDRAVPNSLFFLDKYLQVPRILNPIVLTLEQVPVLARDPFVNGWLEAQFGSVERLVKLILCDFFRHAFDGSGADNFYDAGSCIDGRLTSAWNWANLISKKPYYKVFLVTGFMGFDGTEGF